MNLDAKCGNCRKWARYIEKASEKGNCQALPPVPVQALSTNARGSMTGRLVMFWPVTQIHEVCGLFKHRKGWLFRALNPVFRLIADGKYFVKSLYKKKR